MLPTFKPYSKLMFDPAILLSLQAQMPPQIPFFAQEKVKSSSASEDPVALVRSIAAQHKYESEQWLATMNATRARIELIDTPERATEEGLQKVTSYIKILEDEADGRAVEIARLKRRISRDMKNSRVKDPVAREALAYGGRLLVETEEKIVGELLDYSLFLRAVRADLDPKSRGGKVFDDPDALEKYLDSLI